MHQIQGLTPIKNADLALVNFAAPEASRHTKQLPNITYINDIN
jgi:hypothetical protein